MYGQPACAHQCCAASCIAGSVILRITPGKMTCSARSGPDHPTLVHTVAVSCLALAVPGNRRQTQVCHVTREVRCCICKTPCLWDVPTHNIRGQCNPPSKLRPLAHATNPGSMWNRPDAPHRGTPSRHTQSCLHPTASSNDTQTFVPSCSATPCLPLAPTTIRPHAISVPDLLVHSSN